MMNDREEFDQLTDRQYDVLSIVAKALEVDMKEIYYSDDYLDTMESLAKGLEFYKINAKRFENLTDRLVIENRELNEIISNHNGGE